MQLFDNIHPDLRIGEGVVLNHSSLLRGNAVKVGGSDYFVAKPFRGGR
jgi:hypothetical protein